MANPTTSTDSAVDNVLNALTDVIRGATSPDVQAAQTLLLRRLALEGDVIPSRIPAPRNITEAAGYANLLGDLGLNDMRTQMLGAALGLAGSSPLPGFDAVAPPLALIAISNDRPAGPGGAAVPLTVSVRADFADPLRAALSRVHAAGGLLPLWSPPAVLLPRAPGQPPATLPDPLLALGRELWVAPTTALVDPTSDPVVLGRTATDPGTGFRLALRVNAGTPGADPADWMALQWDQIAGVVIDHHLGTIPLLPLETALGPSGFMPTYPATRPGSRSDYAWAKLTNTAGLVTGISRLSEELSLVHPAAAIAASVFADSLGSIWDGTAFATRSD